MKSAKFISKTYETGYDKNFIFLEYEYRGRRYEIYENRSKGNEPLSWQHKNAQARIDHEIELEEKQKESSFIGESVQESLDKFFEYLET